jgi:glycosyltransferase involved in cell wall biosynthesis
VSSGVAFVLPYVKARGTELQALQLARQLRLRGWTVRLFVIQGWGVEPVLDAFRQCGALVEMLGPPVRVGQKAIDWRRWPRLVLRLQRCGASVVISRAGMANRFACLAALAAGLPSVAVLSSAVIVPDGWRPSLWASLRQRLLWGWPTQIVTVSVESLGRLQRAFPHLRSRSRAIPNGVSSPMVSSREAPRVSSQTLEPGCFHLCTVGSLEIVRKGLDVILQAMALLASRGWNDCRLTLVGSGEDQQLLADLGQRLGISPMLRFVGECSNPQFLVAQSDLFVLPSRREGLPNALLEAMFTGTCVVAADCPTGPAEIIEHGQTGFLVPVADPQTLADQIEQLRLQPEQRRAVAAAGQRMVMERYSPQRCAEAYQRLIVDLVK